MVSEADDNKPLIFTSLSTDAVFGLTAEIISKVMYTFLSTTTVLALIHYFKTSV
jgi:hypothetical protein